MRASYLALPLIVLVTLAAAGCSTPGAQGTTPPAGGGGGRGGGGGGPVPVTVGRATQKPVPLTIEVIGSVEPSSTVSIRAQVTGLLNVVNSKEGDDVREGQVLFELDR